MFSQFFKSQNVQTTGTNKPPPPSSLRALLTSELEKIFDQGAPALINVLVKDCIREAYAQAIATRIRVPDSESDCPVCVGCTPSKFVFCGACGKGLHAECFNKCTSHLSRS
ncbi:hypothetical protein H0H93_012183 [Arthromyces matolae]|nr:hypothetical protein H0H93_012183 [Arthromyces matolae]